MGALVGIAPPVDDVLDVPAPQLPLEADILSVFCGALDVEGGRGCSMQAGAAGAHLYVVAHYSGSELWGRSGVRATKGPCIMRSKS